jgi:hypothetical protein
MGSYYNSLGLPLNELIKTLVDVVADTLVDVSDDGPLTTSLNHPALEVGPADRFPKMADQRDPTNIIL